MQPTHRHITVIATVATVGLVFLTSCGGALQRLSPQPPSAAAPQQSAVDTTRAASGGNAAIAPGAPAPAAARSQAPGAPAQVAPANQNASLPTLPVAQAGDQMLIQNANITLEIKSPTDAQDELVRIARDEGGQATNASSSYQGAQLFIKQTITVPADRFGDTMARVRKIVQGQQGKELGEEITVQDVGEEFADVQAQIKNLQVTEQRLQELMNRATTVESAIAVQNQLTNVQGQIDRLQGRANFLSRKSAMSTIVATLQTPPPTPTRVEIAGWQPSATLVAALDTAANFWHGVIDTLIYAVVILGPIVAILAIIIIVARMFLRRPGPQTPPAPPAAPLGATATTEPAP